MDNLIISGGKKLKGTVSLRGSKNVALKALVAACLTREKVEISNMPLISDVKVMARIIVSLGASVAFKDHKVTIDAANFNKKAISLFKAAEVRTSFMFVVPILVRLNKAIIPNPGGCRIGARPIDRVIEGLKKMGIDVKYLSKDGYFHAEIKGKRTRLKSCEYTFPKNTHTGTETMILAAVLAEGKTVLSNAAEEPEIDELIDLLCKMGARIERVKKRVIEIQGVDKLHGAKFSIGTDRNEAVTFAVAAIASKGDIFVKGITDKYLGEFLEALQKAGGGFEKKEDGIRFYYKKELKAVDIETLPYPGFMTDWQGPWAVLMTQARGVSVLHETVYENRFTYVYELLKMGAKIELFNPNVKNPEKLYNFNIKDDKKSYLHAARIHGPALLHEGVVNVSDLRAGATLVLAALSAPGQSTISGVEHLDRGYEHIESRLKSLGADIKRVGN